MNETIEKRNSLDSTVAAVYAVTRGGKEVPIESIEYELIRESEPIYMFGHSVPAYYYPRSRKLVATIYLSPYSFAAIMASESYFDIHVILHGTKYKTIIKKAFVQKSGPANLSDGFICDCIANDLESELYIPKNVTNRMIAKDLLSEVYGDGDI